MTAHPSHPFTVHFPIAFWITASLCDLAGYWHEGIWHIGNWCLVFGCASSLPAICAGMWQLSIIKKSAPIESTIKWHAGTASIATVCYLTALLLRIEQGQLLSPPFSSIALSVTAMPLLLIAGWHGGSLVYTHGAGVEQNAQAAADQDRGSRTAN